MTTIKFWTPVTYNPFVPPSLGKFLLEKADDYFCLNGKKVSVVPGNEQGNSEGVVAITEAPYKTALKIASYCTLIIPTLVFAAKVILRSIYHFHALEQATLHSGDNAKPAVEGSMPPNRSEPTDTPPPELQIDKKYRLTAEKTAELQIKIPHQDRGQYLKDTAAVQLGVSSLEVYKNSTFEVKYLGHYSAAQDTMEDMHYEVTRRNAVDRTVPFMPLNTGIALKPEVIQQYQLTHSYYEQTCAVFTSTLPEYSDSFFLVSEAAGTIVRILKKL